MGLQVRLQAEQSPQRANLRRVVPLKGSNHPLHNDPVPVDVIRDMLKEGPEAAGIAVPRTPDGSPEMEQGSRKDPYNVMMFDRRGGMWIYARR